MPKLKSRGEGMPELPQEDTLDGPKIFNDMSWNDEMNWDHARLKPLLVYLRGNSSLQLPPDWKAVFPKHIWTCVWPGGSQVKPTQRSTPQTICVWNILRSFEVSVRVSDATIADVSHFGFRFGYPKFLKDGPNKKIWWFLGLAIPNPFEPVRTRSDPFGPLGNATICCLQTRTRSA